MTLEYILIAFWIIIIISGILIEIFSINFITIWFSLGALIALISDVSHFIWYGQIILFAISTVLGVALFYPILRNKLLKFKTLKTNINALIGKEVVVEEIIKQKLINISGYTYINGLRWTFIMINKIEVNPGDVLVIKSIKGTRLITEKKEV